MPRVEYTRTDLVLTLRFRDGGVEMEAAYGGARRRLTLPAGDPAQLPETALRRPLGGAVEAWAAAARKAQRETHIPRVLLRVEGHDLPGDAWEQVAATLADGFQPPAYAVVRETRVPARDAAIPWTLPLRIVHEDVWGFGLVRSAVEDAFGGYGPMAEMAVRVLEVPPAMPGWAPDEEWPTAEIVHLGPFSPLPPGARLSTTTPVEVGTLGWLLRLTDAAQTRLLILEARSDYGEIEARLVASALADRGGPAVLVLRDPTEEAIVGLYDFLVHDRPLDWIVRELQGRGDWHQPPVASVVLVAGAGREEGVRVSGPALPMIELAERLESGDAAAEADLHRVAATLSSTSSFMPGPEGSEDDDGRWVEADMAEIRDSVGRVKSAWDGLRFEDHESGGLIPYATELTEMRTRVLGRGEPRVRMTGGAVSAAPPRPGPTRDDEPDRPARGEEPEAREETTEAPPQSEPTKPPERFVVPRLAEEDGRAIPQEGARLTLGRVVHLGIRIGRPDAETRVVGAAALLDEVLKLRPEDQGAWLEVGVTGIGFDVLGHPVQELWMPRGADSEPITFAVAPRDAEVSVLRYTVYHRGNAVQSFRLAAATVREGKPAAADVRAPLAAALGMEADDVGDAGWLSRLEFSLVADPAEIESRPERAVSIVANHVNGKPVVTVKGGDSFDVWFPGNVSPQVQRIRSLLDQVATRKENGDALYNFGLADPDERPNEGDDATLEEALKTLAEAGWELYIQLFPDDARDTLSSVLEARDGQTIQVAHVLLDKVLPWSLLYDRPFTPNAQVDAQGNALRVDACLAALPGPDGTPSPVRCGQHPCILAAGDPALTPDTVACPRHFWGFTHAVEVPPQQVPPGEPATPQVDVVESGTPASLVSGFNESLSLAKDHRAELEKLEQVVAGRAKWTDPAREFQGQFVVHRLNVDDVDLIYFYCHTRGGTADPGTSPCLEFIGLDSKPARVAPGDLSKGVKWAHHPLVILNGCGSVAFSPDALSPFLPVLVNYRRAAGVLGTEISVWEQLAGEFAEHFLGAFLGGKPAGEALLEARRKLLAQRNPLGLVYTLYASADLRFAAPAAVMR